METLMGHDKNDEGEKEQKNNCGQLLASEKASSSIRSLHLMPRTEYKHVQPRIGSQFQALVLPHKSKAGAANGAAPASKPRTSRRGRPPKHAVSSSLETQVTTERKKSRGAICLHRPTAQNQSNSADDGTKASDITEQEEFLLFSRNLLMQMPVKGVQSTVTPERETWKQETIRKFGMQAGVIKPGVKRKLGEESELISSSFSENDEEDGTATGAATAAAGVASSASEPQQKKLLGAEDDLNMLDYLHRRHDGNQKLAKMSVLLHLSHGKATKARKILHRNLHGERFRQPPPLSSQSWRKRLERECPAILGDIRESTKTGTTRYPYYDASSEAEPWMQLDGIEEESATPQETEIDSHTSSTCDYLDEEVGKTKLRDLWRSILSCAQNMDKAMLSTRPSEGDSRPYLLRVMELLHNAYTLETPEEVFGSRHLIVERISQCLNSILDHVSTARDAKARLMDLLHTKQQDGGLSVDMIQKAVDVARNSCGTKLEECDMLRRFMETASEWESRLAGLEKNTLDSTRTMQDNYEAVEALATEGRALTFRLQSLVQLEERIEKAYSLRDRIREWNKKCSTGKKETIKFISSLVKEATRVEMVFPEFRQLMEIHRQAEEWADRSSIAVRSRISLTEIDSLIEAGEAMPVDVYELLEKLKSRSRQAGDWVKLLKTRVPCPYKKESGGCGEMVIDYVEWMSRMRKYLSGTQCSRLLELATEGSRIPVEIRCLKFLQLEIDARNWSLKAKKWIPVPSTTCNTDQEGETVSSSRRGKLDDLKDHLLRCSSIRGKLPLSEDAKNLWTMEHEKELVTIVDAADAWFDKYQVYLDGDNRKNQERQCIPIVDLRNIVAEAGSIHTNLGNASNKMNRILAQSESWFEKHRELLEKCGIWKQSEGVSKGRVSLDEIKEAVASAASDLPLDLQEAIDLRLLAERIEHWYERTLELAPKRSMRTIKGKVTRKKHFLPELLALINEASELPVDTTDDLDRLQIQLNTVQYWRLQAQRELNTIAGGFLHLEETEKRMQGESSSHQVAVAECANSGAPVAVSMDIDEVNGIPEEKELNPLGVSPGTGAQTKVVVAHAEQLGKVIDELLGSGRSLGIFTAEEEVAEILEKVLSWCRHCIKFTTTPHEVFETRSFEEFDRVIERGENLILLSEEYKERCDIDFEDKNLVRVLSERWGSLVQGGLKRLMELKTQREKFRMWCERVETLLCASEKRVSLDSLRKLAEESRNYPSSAEVVQRVREDATAAEVWARDIRELVELNKKISVQEAKAKIVEGDKLNIACNELKVLRAGMRVARNWASRVKKTGLDQGETHIGDVKSLIEEHDSFIVSMPEELSRLKQAMRGYCICRRPYEGFMIGCDTCDEWYHGACIGVSEAQADKVDKYICLQCSLSRARDACVSSIVGAIRKWTDPCELKKARSLDRQKHQRKVRKENRTMEKLAPEIDKLELELAEIRAQASQERQSCLLSQNVNANPLTSLDRTVDPSRLQSNNDEVCDSTSTAQIPEEHGVAQRSDGDTEKENEQNSTGGIGTDASVGEIRKEEQELREKVEKMAQCKERLVQLEEIAIARTNMEKKEDENRHALRRYFKMIRVSIISPMTEEGASKSRPNLDGTTSEPMKHAIAIAQKSGLCHVRDVRLCTSSLSSICWCFRALRMLSKKPRVEELASVLNQSRSVKLPEEKTVRNLKSLSNRASQWQGKATKALLPKAGESKSFDVELLKDLLAQVKDIPVIMPEEIRLLNTIDDNGMRHCSCGGPSDGSFMMCCDKCDCWFHGLCADLSSEESGSHTWVCIKCSHSNTLDEDNYVIYKEERTHGAKFIRVNEDEGEGLSSHSSNAERSWPPFGLGTSEKTTEAFGEPLALDDVDLVEPVNFDTTFECVQAIETSEAQRKNSSGSSDSKEEFKFAQDETDNSLADEGVVASPEATERFNELMDSERSVVDEADVIIKQPVSDVTKEVPDTGGRGFAGPNVTPLTTEA